jgi:catechol 2,3-dioxygenase-like lactoylglutathione lyase family enzyme
MITGAHSIVYTRDAEADRAFFRDVLNFPNVDVGGGWLIFALPPSEVAFHPGSGGRQEFYLMCEDAEEFAAAMARHGVRCSPRQHLGWGVRTELSLPSGARLGVYQPLHARPKAGPTRPAKRGRSKAKPVKRASKAKPVKRAAGAARRKSRARRK